MISIPEELLEQFERGNVLLFIGEQVGRDVEGQTSVDQLTAELATRCGIDQPEEYTFPEVAQAYQDATGRQALVQFVRDQLEALGDEPKEIHRLIAGLTRRLVLVTTALDRRLERAFEEKGRPLHVIIGNMDVPFDDERTTQLYKLRGSAERVESLVLTEDDHEVFFEDQASISVALQGYLVRKTIVFVGYDLADAHFKRLYRKVTAPLDAYARRAYAFGQAPSSLVFSWCKRHGIQVVEVRPATYLEELTRQLAERARPVSAVQPQLVEQPALPIPVRPYKLLDFYEAGDAAIFFGREQETQLLTSLIHAHRLAVLYGASGTGKTSLLLAGVVPQLERADPPYETVTVRALEDPLLIIRRDLRRRLPEADLSEDGSLLEFLDAATRALERSLVIILDQFEEFFVRFGPNFRASFFAELGALYDARDLPVKLVFSLREDWLASMSEVEERIPGVYRAKMRLLPLSRQQAGQAITQPVEQLGMAYAPALVDKLLDDLVDGQADQLAMGEAGGVMPPQLQLVCDALYERARTEGRQAITMADYESMGGARDILARHIEEALREHPGQEREAAKRVLACLVTSQATKVAMDQKSICVEVGADTELIGRVLSRLVRQRLVRRLDEGRAYELIHDILADSIAGWIDDEDRELKRTRELLRRELADWQQDPGILLSQGKFQRINAARDGLRLSDEEAAFLLRAAVMYADGVPYWLDQVAGPDAQAGILLEMLENAPPPARLTAARYLAGFSQDRVATALAHTALEDSEPGVRDMAAVSLGGLGVEAGARLLIDAVSTPESPQQAQAVRALALIRDVAPDQLTALRAPIRRQVSNELGKIRLRRNWPSIRMITAAGAIGGTLGFGLGLSPPLAVHTARLLGAQSIRDVIFIAPLVAVFGLLAGAATALGISAGEALWRERAGMGRALGGTLLGGLGFAVCMSPLAIVDAAGLLDVALTVAGAGLLGALTGLGLTLPAIISRKRAVVLPGGLIGAALGVVVWGALGFKPFQIAPEPSVPLPVLLACGGLLGLIMAWSVTWAAVRWPIDKTEAQEQLTPTM
jgi:hypothetical protein